MNIGQVIDALPSLQKLVGQDLSIKKLYKVSKLLGNLENEVAFYNEQRAKIISKYCDVVEGRYKPREEDVDKLNAELNELYNTEIEYEINEVVIGLDENIKMSYNDLVMLQGFVRIGEE